MITYPLTLHSGVTTRVHDAGHGNSRPAVLVHGLGARADRWRHNVDALAALGLRVAAVDLPGHGFAGKGAAAPHTVPAMRDTVLEVLDVLRADGADEPVVLLGTSLGGNICAAVTVAAPERVSHLMMIGSLGLEPLGPQRRKGFGTRVTHTSREDVTEKLQRLVADQRLVTTDWLEEEYRINNSGGAAAFFKQIGRYITTSIDDDLVGKQLHALADRVRIELLWGGRDLAVPVEVGRRAAERYGFPLTVFEDSAHAPYFEEQDRFNDIVTEFVKS